MKVTGAYLHTSPIHIRGALSDLWLYPSADYTLASGPVNPDPAYLGGPLSNPLVPGVMTPDHPLSALKGGVAYSNMAFAFDFALRPASGVSSAAVAAGRGVLSGVTIVGNQIRIANYRSDVSPDILECVLWSVGPPAVSRVVRIDMSVVADDTVPVSTLRLDGQPLKVNAKNFTYEMAVRFNRPVASFGGVTGPGTITNPRLLANGDLALTYRTPPDVAVATLVFAGIVDVNLRRTNANPQSLTLNLLDGPAFAG